ncbi:MAG: hypothetical protein U0T82_03365 [Bacteroidales bacterium]
MKLINLRKADSIAAVTIGTGKAMTRRRNSQGTLEREMAEGAEGSEAAE